MIYGKVIQWFKISGFLLLFYLLSKLDIRSIIDNYANIHHIYLIPYFLLYLSMMAVKSIRWKQIVAGQGLHYSYYKAMSISAITQFWGSITPGRVGEFGKLAYLKSDGLGTRGGIINVLLDRFLDLALLLLVAGGSSVYFAKVLFGLEPMTLVGYSILLAATTVLGAYLVYRMIIAFPAVKTFYFDRFFTLWRNIRQDIFLVVSNLKMKLVLLTLLSFLLYLGQLIVLLKLFNADFSILFLVIMSFSLAAIISLVPITIAGIGTREALFVCIFSSAGLSPELGISLAFFDSVIFAYICNISLFIFFALFGYKEKDSYHSLRLDL